MLNLIQHLSGIASFVNQLNNKALKKNIKILDTRKTTPGMRLFEKYAVKCGGGYNHRFVSGLANAITTGGDYVHTFQSADTNGIVCAGDAIFIALRSGIVMGGLVRCIAIIGTSVFRAAVNDGATSLCSHGCRLIICPSGNS